MVKHIGVVLMFSRPPRDPMTDVCDVKIREPKMVMKLAFWRQFHWNLSNLLQKCREQIGNFQPICSRALCELRETL